MRRFLPVLLAASATGWPAPGATAEPCGEDNLLAGRQPVAWFDAFRPQLVTDGIAAQDGDPELGSRSAVLGSDRAFLEYDLGVDRLVTAALLQVGPRARYAVELSSDRQAWQPLFVLPPSGEDGLHMRAAKGFAGRGRYLRLTAKGATGSPAVAELQVFCRAPGAPPLEARAATLPASPQTVAVGQARRALLLLLPAGAALLLLLARARSRRRDRLALAAAAAALVTGLAFAAPSSTPWLALASAGAVALAAAVVALAGSRRVAEAPSPRLRCAAAALLVGVAAMAYTNYGRFGGYWSVHYHDVLHYALGAKYAPELRYDGLYACLLEASSGESGWTSVRPAAIRDLRTGHMVPSAAVLAGPPCRARFTPERWQAFQNDARLFQAQLSPAGWVAVFADHGYNATPVWTGLWRPWFEARPLSVPLLEAYVHVDEIAYALVALLALWAWGPVVGAAAALLFGLGFPWIYLWTGGGVGRSLWLLSLITALALASRRRCAAAGIALGFSSALQLFPALLLAGPLLLAGRREATSARAGARRLVVAAVLTGTGLAVLSFLVAGPSLWIDFAANTAKHLGADSVNRIGAMALASGPGWPEPVGWLLAGLGLGVWAWAALRVRDTARLLSLALLVPVFALRLSSYYLALVAGLAPLLDTRSRMAAALVTLLAIPHAVAWIAGGAPGPGAYAFMSAAIVGFGVALCVLEARRHPADPGAMAENAGTRP